MSSCSLTATPAPARAPTTTEVKSIHKGSCNGWITAAWVIAPVTEAPSPPTGTHRNSSTPSSSAGG